IRGQATDRLFAAAYPVFWYLGRLHRRKDDLEIDPEHRSVIAGSVCGIDTSDFLCKSLTYVCLKNIGA
ncbi:MAG: hypothetical protein KAV45_10615, partial [Calditrichia bacterium]|nr:hypothetical protein [Calditrichia bacterium]